MPIILNPESTYIVCPVIPLEKSEAKNELKVAKSAVNRSEVIHNQYLSNLNHQED